MSKHHSPNDQRSIAMNPNNSAHQAALNNRSQQLDPQNPKYNGSSGKSDSGKKK